MLNNKKQPGEPVPQGRLAQWPPRWLRLGAVRMAWLVAFAALASEFLGFPLSSFVVVRVLCGVGVGGVLYVFRKKARVLYGLFECGVGIWLLSQVIIQYSGAFTSDYTTDFERLAPSIFILQSFAGLFLITQGLESL